MADTEASQRAKVKVQKAKWRREEAFQIEDCRLQIAEWWRRVVK